MKSVTRLKVDHPRWRYSNIEMVAAEEDEWAQVRCETLFENKCVRCSREMGEHGYDVSAKMFRCP